VGGVWGANDESGGRGFQGAMNKEGFSLYIFGMEVGDIEGEVGEGCSFFGVFVVCPADELDGLGVCILEEADAFLSVPGAPPAPMVEWAQLNL